MPEEVTFEYEHCPLRSRAHRLARIMPPIRPLARSLSGYVRIGWDEVGAVHRARTTWGRMTVHVVAGNPRRHIEIAESMPGFDSLVPTILHNARIGEIVHLPQAA